MQWASALSELPETKAAMAEVVSAAGDRLGGAADLAVLFVSPHHLKERELISREVRAAFPGATLIGCSGGGIIGDGKEVEDAPAVALAVASLPGVRLTPFHLANPELPDPDQPGGWRERLGFAPDASPHFVLLPDPLSCNVERLVTGLDAAFGSASCKVGGLVSGGTRPGAHTLWLDETTHDRGVVGLALEGDVQLRTILAQGCRPIGEPMLVTSCDDNIIYQVEGHTPVEALKALLEELDEGDRELARHSLFVGIEMKDQVEYHQGEFLIRNLLGLDPERGAIAVAARVRRWQAVQFHLRDSATSADDLAHQLAAHGRAAPGAGALLFSCLGRGEQLYGQPHHDSHRFRDVVGDVPLAGFFCNGEIGPVAGRTFVHGYTSSFGVFTPA